LAEARASGACEPGLPLGNQLLACGLAHHLPLRRALAADLRLDLVWLGDPSQRFLGNRQSAIGAGPASAIS
jgi:hypothetical protein